MNLIKWKSSGINTRIVYDGYTVGVQPKSFLGQFGQAAQISLCTGNNFNVTFAGRTQATSICVYITSSLRVRVPFQAKKDCANLTIECNGIGFHEGHIVTKIYQHTEKFIFAMHGNNKAKHEYYYNDQWTEIGIVPKRIILFCFWHQPLRFYRHIGTNKHIENPYLTECLI